MFSGEVLSSEQAGQIEMQAWLHLSRSPASSVAVEIGLKRSDDSLDFSVDCIAVAELIAPVLRLQSEKRTLIDQLYGAPKAND